MFLNFDKQAKKIKRFFKITRVKKGALMTCVTNGKTTAINGNAMHIVLMKVSKKFYKPIILLIDKTIITNYPN